jgi:ABC-type transporter Mla subunit MlaD
VAIIAVQGELFADALASFGGRARTEAGWQETIAREVALGLRVRVAWKDITGQKYLEVDYLDPEDYPPPLLGIVPDLPYLPTAVSPSLQDIQKDLATTLGALSKVDYQRLGAQMQQLLEQVTQRVEEFRSDEVSASFRDAADALRKLAEDASLKQAFVRFDEVGADAQTLLRRANDLLAKPELDTAVTDLAAAAKSLRSVTTSLEAQLPDAVRQVETVATEARKAITDSRLPETAEAVRAGVRDVSGAARSVSAVREDLRTALRELGEASRNIGRLADYLERHPEAILSGRTGAGGTR